MPDKAYNIHKALNQNKSINICSRKIAKNKFIKLICINESTQKKLRNTLVQPIGEGTPVRWCTSRYCLPFTGALQDNLNYENNHP